jgi:hypothetical protein
MDTNAPLETPSRRVHLPGFAAAFSAACRLSDSHPEQVLDRATGRGRHDNDQRRAEKVA